MSRQNMGCDEKAVADAELHPIVIQLAFTSDNQSGCSELICFSVAGSEVYRCLLSDLDSLEQLRLSVSSELSVPPYRLKLVQPHGSVVGPSILLAELG